MEGDGKYQEPDCDSEPSDETPESIPHPLLTVPTTDESHKTQRWPTDRIVELSLAVAVTVFTGVLTWVSWGQWRVMQGQLEEMKGTSKQTEDMLTETRRFADSMEASATQSRAALAHSIETSRLEQRAWIGIKHHGVERLEPDRFIKGEVSFINNGRSPALNTGIAVAITRVPNKDYPVDFFETAKKGASGYKQGLVVLPNGTLTMPVIADQKATKEEIDAIDVGKRALYLHFYVSYEDVFHGKHFLEGCTKYNPIDREMHYCQDRNRTDDK